MSEDMKRQDMKRQLFQSIGQFVVVVVSGLLIYKDFAEFHTVGAANALWQPTLQAILSVAGIWGVSKLGPVGSNGK